MNYKLELFGFWFSKEFRFCSLSEADAYFDDKEIEELLEPLYKKVVYEPQ